MATGQDFRTDGGATWLNLLATRGQTFGTHPVERLPDGDAVRSWLTTMGLVPADPVSEHDRERLIALREALRDLALSAVAHRDATAEAHRTVTACASGSTAAIGSDAQAVPVGAALSAIALDAILTLRGPDRALLKECAETDCRWVFLDPSGRRRWCPAPACASRGRVRAHRAAQAAGAVRAHPAG